MDRQYIDSVRLLLAVAPLIFESPRFALKGGTALNLFVQDLPRLSVDIDVAFWVGSTHSTFLTRRRQAATEIPLP